MKPLSEATAALFRPIEFSANQHLRLDTDSTLDNFILDLWEQRPGGRYVPEHAVEIFVKRFPTSKQVSTGNSPRAYMVPATDTAVELINDIWPATQLEFADDNTRIHFLNILTQSRFAEQCADVVANFKLNGIVPENYYECAEEKPLSPYQQIANYCMLQSTGFGLYMEQGTGKTAPTIATICNSARYLHNGLLQTRAALRMHRTLIVAPNNVRMNWQKEFAQFATVPYMLNVMRGGEILRMKQLIDSMNVPKNAEEYPLATVVVCGYGTLVKSWDVLKAVEWDIAVLDEAHNIKSPKTKRTETAMLLRDRSKQRFVLTGTPIANSAMDLYALFEFMGKGYSGFNTFEEFRQFYGVYDFQDGHASLVGMQNMPLMQERLARYSMFISKAEANLNLPEKVYDVYEIEMGAEQQEYYNTMAAQMAVEIEATLNSGRGRSMAVNNVMTQLLRLSQITSGFATWSPVVDDEGNVLQPREVNYFDERNPKIEAILDMLSEKGPDEKTIIWACWIPDIELISAALKQNGYDHVTYYGATSDEDRDYNEWRYNFDPSCRVMVANAGAGGSGLNLLGYPPNEPGEYTTNTTHEIYMSQDWSHIKRAQSEDRGHRRGTRVVVRITDLVAPRTIDEQIRVRVVEKRTNAMTISDLREILSNVFIKL